MDDRLNILMNEYSELRDTERATRALLYQINVFSATIVSGLLIAITVYKIEIIALVSPLIFYLVGFLWSTESMRLLRVTAHIRLIEREVRKILGKPGTRMLKGFEDLAHPGNGIPFFLRYNSILVANALMYAILYLMFFYLLATTNYDVVLKIVLIVIYVIFGSVFWGFDALTNRRYLNPKGN